MHSSLKATGGVKRRGAMVRSCLAVCLLLAAASAGAQQERPPFEFAESGPLSFQPGEASEVWVLNNTTRPLSLEVGLIGGAAADGRGLSSFLEVGPNPLPVPAAGGAKITLRVKQGETLAPGAPFTAHLVISDGGSNMVKRRPVNVGPQGKTGGSNTPATPRSLVGSLKATAYCGPLDDGCDLLLDEMLPLDEIKRADIEKVLKADAPLAYLAAANASGETALIIYKGDEQNLAGGTTGVRLGFKSDGTPGEYTGQILGIKTGGERPEDVKPVTLTVVSKHPLWCAVLIALLGILTFYLMQWWLNVLRKVSILEQQQAELEVAFDRAEAHFRETAAGKEYEEDSIRGDFKKQLNDLLREIKKLRFDNFVKLDESGAAFKGIVAKLDALREVAGSWGIFAEGSLNPLADALAAADPISARRPQDGSLPAGLPQVARDADRLLAGVGPMTIVEFKERAAEVDELPPRLSPWRSLNERAARVWERFRDIVGDEVTFNKLEPLKQEDIKAKKEQAFVIWHTLWASGEFDPMQVRRSLSDLEASLAALAGQNLPVAATAVASAVPEVAASASPEERAERIGLLRLGFDLFNFCLAVAVAVYTSLTVFYFGKPFGTLRDYVAAFVLGLGTRPALEMVIGALNRFTSRTA